jgi:hypothetical protein
VPKNPRPRYGYQQKPQMLMLIKKSERVGTP